MANPEHLERLHRGVSAWNEWRASNPAVRPDLSQASLRAIGLNSADLAKVNLLGADMSGAELCKANLSYAKLRDAALKGADLRWANLSRADLTLADLRGADLRGADLTSADFRAAHLGNAKLAKAALRSTRFVGISDLAACEGLSELVHLGPSYVDPTTAGGLPPAFLKGVGWPERLIEYWPAISLNAVHFYSAFISYSHEDNSFAETLHGELQQRGIRCWKDDHQILPGHDIADEIDRGIRTWDKVLLCCSKASLSSPWVDREIGMALQKEERIWKERDEKTLAIVPLVLDDYLFKSWESGKASMVRERLAADFRGWESDRDKFETQLELVVKALQTPEDRLPGPDR